MVPSVKYNDHSVRIVLALVAANIILLYNDAQNFFEAILSISYIRSFIILSIISYLVISLVYMLTVKLDRLYDWHSNTLMRFLWQVVLGLLVPAILFYICMAAFFYLGGKYILDTDYMQRGFPVAFFMLLTLNLYYFGLYSFLKRIKPDPGEATTGENSMLFENHSTDSELTQPATEGSGVTPVRYKEMLMIDTLNGTIPVAADDIAYAYRLGGVVFIRLKSMEHLSDSYQVSYTIKDLETILDPAKFFRINRQMLVNYSCCIAYHLEKNRTLSITLDPQPYPVNATVPKEHLKLHVVSEDRSPKFKLWMDR